MIGSIKLLNMWYTIVIASLVSAAGAQDEVRLDRRYNADISPPADLTSSSDITSYVQASIESTLSVVDVLTRSLDGIIERLDGLTNQQQILYAAVNSIQSKTKRDFDTLVAQQVALQESVVTLAADAHAPPDGECCSKVTGLEASLNSAIAQQASFKDLFFDALGAQTRLSNAIHDIDGRQGLIQESLNTVTTVAQELRESINFLSENQSEAEGSLTNVVTQQSIFGNLLSSVSSNLTDLSDSLHHLNARQDECVGSVSVISTRQIDVEESLRDQKLQQMSLEANITQLASALHQALTVTEKSHTVHYLGFPCSDSEQCSEYVSNSTCIRSGVCACSDRFRQADGSISQCEQFSARLGDSCTDDSQCLEYSDHSRCLTPQGSDSGVCVCEEGFWNRDNEECRARTRLLESCTFEGDCSQGTCREGQCQCPIARFGRYEYKLSGASNCSAGNIEVRCAELSPNWGFVCDDGWDGPDAMVVCRSMGFQSGTAVQVSKFRGGSDNFNMDDVTCTGTENHLMECGYAGWQIENCGHQEVAGVLCSQMMMGSGD